MNWSDLTEQVMHFQLFTIGGQGISPRHILMLGGAILITLYMARWVGHLFQQRFFSQLQIGARYTLARLAQYLVWVIGIMVGLKVVHIDLTGIAVVAGALGVGIGFGLQNIVSNFVAGLVLLFERPIKVSDRVTVENVEGNVKEINFRSTTIVTNDNIAIIVPNSEFISRTVVNWSHSDSRVRIHVPVGVAYGSDVELVTRTLLEAAVQNEDLLKDPAPTVWFKEFGESSLNFELLVWTDQPDRHFRVRSSLNYAIDAAFRRHNIQIPFPQRDLHMKSAQGLAGLLAKTPA